MRLIYKDKKSSGEHITVVKVPRVGGARLVRILKEELGPYLEEAKK